MSEKKWCAGNCCGWMMPPTGSGPYGCAYPGLCDFQRPRGGATFEPTPPSPPAEVPDKDREITALRAQIAAMEQDALGLIKMKDELTEQYAKEKKINTELINEALERAKPAEVPDEYCENPFCAHKKSDHTLPNHACNIISCECHAFCHPEVPEMDEARTRGNPAAFKSQPWPPPILPAQFTCSKFPIKSGKKPANSCVGCATGCKGKGKVEKGTLGCKVIGCYDLNKTGTCMRVEGPCNKQEIP